MRVSPLARDALLVRVGALPSARLPEPELDMQARHVLNPAGAGAAERLWRHDLISVFLTPDEGLDLSGAEVGVRPGEQRPGGVLRFGEHFAGLLPFTPWPRGRACPAPPAPSDGAAAGGHGP